MGSDLPKHIGTDVIAVSIHAPTWGATRLSKLVLSDCLFQSTLPHGERLSVSDLPLCSRSFNPRSHIGSDLSALSPARLLHGFNPRSHMGSDTWNVGRRLYDFVSIHAPTWGATQVYFQNMIYSLFQSTLPHGERPTPRLTLTARACFNPRSHMGSDRPEPHACG